MVLLNIKCVVVTGEISQYLDYVPVPYFDPQSCNSTEHYNGQLQVDALCTGTRADKSTCRVSTCRQLGFRNRDVLVWESGWAYPQTISSIFDYIVLCVPPLHHRQFLLAYYLLGFKHYFNGFHRFKCQNGFFG